MLQVSVIECDGFFLCFFLHFSYFCIVHMSRFVNSGRTAEGAEPEPTEGRC